MRDSVPSGSYSSVCNVLRQWNILLFQSWKQATFDEIKVFVVMKLNMALVQLSQLKDYWFTHETLNLYLIINMLQLRATY